MAIHFVNREYKKYVGPSFLKHTIKENVLESVIKLGIVTATIIR